MHILVLNKKNKIYYKMYVYVNYIQECFQDIIPYWSWIDSINFLSNNSDTLFQYYWTVLQQCFHHSTSKLIFGHWHVKATQMIAYYGVDGIIALFYNTMDNKIATKK